MAMPRRRPWILCCFLWIVPAAVRGQSVAFVDAAGQPASVYLEVTRAYARVVDSGANQNGAVTESVTVPLTTAVWSDQEFLTLQETGPDTGVFEGSIALRSAGPIVPGNGILETGVSNGHYDTLTASYMDSGGTPRTATASTLGYRVWFLDASGTAVTSYVPGAGMRAYVRLEDHNFNNPNRIDFLYAELTSSNGDHEYLPVNETGLDTGIYEGSIPLESAAATLDDGHLQAGGGDQISADRQGAWFPAPVYARIDAASIVFVDAAGQPAAEILENGMARVRVNHPQANTNPGAVETVNVLLQSQYAGDQETITLTETGPDTALFEGSVPLQYGGYPSFDDGILATASSLEPQHEQIQATYGIYNATAHTVGARLTFIGLRGQPMTSYSLRSLVRIKLEDLIDNDPGQIDTLWAMVSSPAAYDFEPIALTETGNHTGIFYGSLPSAETAGSSYDGLLWAEAGQTVTARFIGWPGQFEAQASFNSNYVPVVENDFGTTDQTFSLSLPVLSNDYDPEGGSISLTAASQGERGSVTFDPDGSVTYAPSPGTFGTDTFTYVVADEQGGEALGTVTIDVNGVPVAHDDAASVDEDASVEIPVLDNDSDPENYPLQVVVSTPPEHGTAEATLDRTVIYTPAAGFHGTDTFVYRVADNHATVAFATVTVTVNSINDPPVANADSWGVEEDTTPPINVLANDTDPDGDTLTIASVSQPAQGTVQINPDQTLTYAPPPNFTGDVSFTYTVSDGNGGTATAVVTVSVSPVNDPPVANADTATVAEDGTVNVAVLTNDSDMDGDTLTVAAATQGAHGTVAVNPDKTVKYTPAANYNGADSFTYTISDGHGGTATASVAVSITTVNDAPVAVNDSRTVAAGSAVTIPVLANDADVDGPNLSVSVVTQGAHGTVAINAGQTVTYTASLYIGSDTFTYTVADGAGGTATATANITITAPARVATGLQARYDFNEGSGSTVSDTSGVGTPLNLTIASPSSVSWISGGLRVNTATAISSSGFASKIISAAQSGNAITVEAWVSPSSLTLSGPARIATIVKNSSQRNLVFGQSGNRYETQIKTSSGTPSLQSPASSLTQALAHVVYTRSSSGAAVCYIDGVQVSTQTAAGNLSSWGTDQKLTLADNWKGSYYLLAVYGRALTGAEVQQNYLAGANVN